MNRQGTQTYQSKNIADITVDESDNSDEDEEDKRTLFVCNLHEKITEELLYELFIQAGPIENVRIPKEKDGKKLKTFGFITYIHKVSIPYALSLYDGIKLFNKNLIIKCRNANSRNQKNDSLQYGSSSSSLNNSELLSPMAIFDHQAKLFDIDLINQLGINQLPNMSNQSSSNLHVENYQPNRSRDNSLHNRNRYNPYNRENNQNRFDKPYDRQKYGNRRNDRFSDQRQNNFRKSR